MKRFFLFFLTPFLLGCRQNVPMESVSTPMPAPTPAPYTVILDFGHGGFDGGAIGIETGVIEADLNLAIGRLVETALSERGCAVILTRPDENALAETKRGDMQVREEILGQSADCTVSIHMNKFTDRSVSGPMAFYQAGAEEGQRLAQCVIDSITAALDRAPRSANPANNFVTRVPKAPSVLVECGFLSNAGDERLLQDTTYQKTLAEAIAAGVMAYFDLREAGQMTDL